MNLYQYAGNNPVMYVDPSGESSEWWSFGTDFVPVVGNVKSAVEAASGKDYITGEELSTNDRWWAASGIFYGGFKKLKYLGKIDELGSIKNSTALWDIKKFSKGKISYNFNGQRVTAYQDATKKGYW